MTGQTPGLATVTPIPTEQTASGTHSPEASAVGKVAAPSRVQAGAVALGPLAIKSIAGMPARLGTGLARAVPVAAYHIVRLGPAGLTGLAAILAAVFFGAATLLAVNDQNTALRREIARAQHHPSAEVPQEDPLGKVISTLPTREQIPAVIRQVLQQAGLAGVALDSGHYAYSAPKTGVVGRYEMEFPVKAEYPNIRDFIDRTLSAVPSAGLDRLRLERKVVADAVVKADVRFVVFVRSAPEK